MHLPNTKDDMRNLDLSPFLSKGLEQVLVEWLVPYVTPFLSHDQLGGRKKCSTNHYHDRREVAAMTVDLASAMVSCSPCCLT